MQFFVQIGLKMEAGDCPALNINAMRAISVKSYLNAYCEDKKYRMFFPQYFLKGTTGALIALSANPLTNSYLFYSFAVSLVTLDISYTYMYTNIWNKKIISRSRNYQARST